VVLSSVEDAGVREAVASLDLSANTRLTELSVHDATMLTGLEQVPGVTQTWLLDEVSSDVAGFGMTPLAKVMRDESGRVTGIQPREGPTDEYTYDEAGRLVGTSLVDLRLRRGRAARVRRRHRWRAVGAFLLRRPGESGTGVGRGPAHRHLRVRRRRPPSRSMTTTSRGESSVCARATTFSAARSRTPSAR